VLIIGFLFSGSKMGVAFGVKVTFINRIQRIGVNNLCFLVVDVIELSLER